MKITITFPTEQDRVLYSKQFGSTFTSDYLSDSRKLIVEQDGNSASLFVLNDDFNRLGEEYIRGHVALKYSKAFNEWYVSLSQNDYYNDLGRNPIKEIIVEFVGIQKQTGMEIYRAINGGTYYLREVSAKNDFSKWSVCGKKVTDENARVVRPNLVFICKGQKEKVMYDEWNGVAAYDQLPSGERLHNKCFLDAAFIRFI